MPVKYKIRAHDDNKIFYVLSEDGTYQYGLAWERQMTKTWSCKLTDPDSRNYVVEFEAPDFYAAMVRIAELGEAMREPETPKPTLQL